MPVLSSEKYLACLLFREIFAEGFRRKYKKKVIGLFKISDKKRLANLLQNSISKNDIVKIFRLLSKLDFEKLNRCRLNLRIKFILKNLPAYMRAYKVNRKRVIAILGIDGSGKTTVSNTCFKILKNSNIHVAWYYLGRGKGNVLPIKKTAGLVKAKIEKKSKWLKTFIFSTAAFAYALDFIIRSLTLKKSKTKIIITDRYSSDILLMPNTPRILRRFLFTFLPKAKKYIYIYAEIKTLHSRRKDHDIADLKRQEKEFAWVNRIL